MEEGMYRGGREEPVYYYYSKLPLEKHKSRIYTLEKKGMFRCYKNI